MVLKLLPTVEIDTWPLADGIHFHHTVAPPPPTLGSGSSNCVVASTLLPTATAGTAGWGWTDLAAAGAWPLDGLPLQLLLDPASPSPADAVGATLAPLAAALEQLEGPAGAGKPLFVSALVLAGAPDSPGEAAALSAVRAAIEADPRAFLAAETSADMWPGAPPDPREAAPAEPARKDAPAEKSDDLQQLKDQIAAMQRKLDTMS